MRKVMTKFNKQHRDFPHLQVSFLTRAKTMEVCFGDPEKDEPNIAASILRSLNAVGADERVLVS
jgi:hypothetical protein